MPGILHVEAFSTRTPHSSRFAESRVLASRHVDGNMIADTATAPSPAPLPTPEPARGMHGNRIRDFYSRYEKYTGLALFCAGFIWDSLTITRIDNPIDNLILLAYLAAIGAIIFIGLRRECGQLQFRLLDRVQPRFLWAMQFCFGGLFSSYVVLYFKSASWSRTQLFFLVLVILLIGNEFLERRLANAQLLAVLYSFCLFSFLAFFFPVMLHAINVWIFLLAGVSSAAISVGLFWLGLRGDAERVRRRMVPISAWIVGVFVGVNLLYFANLIPPVPLALKSIAVYHSVSRTNDGYLVQYVPPPWHRFWKKWDDPFLYVKGERVYCYAAIFAPSKVRVPVFHVWRRKSADGWIRTDRIRIDISGGRDGGYRGFTAKSGVAPGQWRVEVETERGQTLGRRDFEIVAAPPGHPLETRLLQ